MGVRDEERFEGMETLEEIRVVEKYLKRLETHPIAIQEESIYKMGYVAGLQEGVNRFI